MGPKQKVRDQQDMKLHNRALVWELIFNARPISRAQLAKLTAMSPTSITRIVGDLIGFGLLRETPAAGGVVGRKATMLDVARDAFFSVGVDVDVDSMQTCLLDLDNQPRAFLERNFAGRRLSPRGALEMARDMHRSMLDASGIAPEKVMAVGLSVSGVVDRDDGRIVISPQLHWKDVALRGDAEKLFGAPAYFENDVKAAIIEECVRHRECRGDTVAYLTIGSGIGSALMCDGRVVRGGNNAAGEVGHIIVQPDGEQCDCGRKGCLYTCLSEKSLLRRIRRAVGAAADLDAWREARRRGEAWAVALADEVGGHIATALNHTLCSYDPEVTIVGGRLLRFMPELLDAALTKKDRIYEALLAKTRIMRSLSEGREAVIGAAIVAKTGFLESLLHRRA